MRPSVSQSPEIVRVQKVTGKVVTSVFWDFLKEISQHFENDCVKMAYLSYLICKIKRHNLI